MSFLADVGRSNAGQVGQGIFSDLMKYKQMERQGERDAMTTVAQAQQMDIARKGAEIQQAKELRDKAEFDAKQKEANRRLPLTLRWGPMESWSESKKAIIAEGRAMGLVEDVGGVPTASPNDYKTFIESLDPAKAVNISAMNLSEHAADMGEIQRKLAAKPGDEKLIAERDRIVGLYTQQKEKHDELVIELAAQKRAEEGGGKPKHTYIDPTDKQPVDQLPNGSFVKGGQPFTGDLTTLVAVGAPKDSTALPSIALDGEVDRFKRENGREPTKEERGVLAAKVMEIQGNRIQGAAIAGIDSGGNVILVKVRGTNIGSVTKSNIGGQLQPVQARAIGATEQAVLAGATSFAEVLPDAQKVMQYVGPDNKSVWEQVKGKGYQIALDKGVSAGVPQPYVETHAAMAHLKTWAMNLLKGQGSDEMRQTFQKTFPTLSDSGPVIATKMLKSMQIVRNYLGTYASTMENSGKIVPQDIYTEMGNIQVFVNGIKESQGKSVVPAPVIGGIPPDLPKGTKNNGDGTFTLPNGKRVRPQ